MKGKLVDLIPHHIKVEIDDIGPLFWRYCEQSPQATPHQVARLWFDQMNAVCFEEWGEDLKLGDVH